MTVLCTFPGKHGDLLWALPTVRAISELYAVPVDLQIGQHVGSLAPLLHRQPYIGHVHVDPQWIVQNTAPPTPFVPPVITRGYELGYDRVFHLGYDAWPAPDLPRDIYQRFLRQLSPDDRLNPPPLDLSTPWITAPYSLPKLDVCIGFTDEHFELKYGLYYLLYRHMQSRTPYWQYVNLSTSPRWQGEGELPGYTWEAAAAWLATTRVFLGCCSALHVLACAMGIPVILMEPAEARWNDIFYPYGKTGPQVQLVLGGDGRSTWDARHIGDAIDAALEQSNVQAMPQPVL